jgi:hypothetical protein
MRQTTKYVAGLIALYLVVFNASKGGILLKEGASGGSKVIKTLQGR